MEISRARMLVVVGLSTCTAAVVAILPLSLIARIASPSGGAQSLIAAEHGWGKAIAFMLVAMAAIAALTAAIGWLLLPRLGGAEVEYVPFFLALCIAAAAAATVCLALTPASLLGGGLLAAVIFVGLGSVLGARDAVAVGYIAPVPERPRLVIDESLEDLPTPRVALSLEPAATQAAPPPPTPSSEAQAPSDPASAPALAPLSEIELAETAAVLVRLVSEWRGLSPLLGSRDDPEDAPVVTAKIGALEFLARAAAARLAPHKEDAEIASVRRALVQLGDALAATTTDRPTTGDARARTDAVCESVAASPFLRDWVARHRRPADAPASSD